MMNIVNKAQEYIQDLLSTKLPGTYVYHNYAHTLEVMETSVNLAEKLNLSEEDIEILTLAALFHDSGYVKGVEDHEEKGVEICREFLLKNEYPENKLNNVIKCIYATKFDAKPENILEQIIRDADLIHIGKKGSNSKAELLRLELLNTRNKKIDESEWLKLNLDFIVKHEFYTSAAKSEYGEMRKENIAKLEKKILKLSKEKMMPNETKKGKANKNIENRNDYNSLIRGTQTIFRITSANHIRLSEIADHKASIMLSVSSIILSIIIRVLLDYPKYNIPTLILIGVSLLSIITATLSTIPMVTSGFISRDDVLKKKGNLLFFGNFHKMSIEDYSWSMKQLMNDKEYLYDTLVRDVYYLGKVLGRKYKYIRMSYMIFMYGMTISVLSFLYTYFFL
jgi:putative nucleotidyltransferase with HDIG domain